MGPYPAMIGFFLILLCARLEAQTGDSPAGGMDLYRMSVAADEVSLTFHVDDLHGLPIDDLKLDEVRLYDAGERQRKVLKFQFLKDFPLRVAILLDTSASMEGVAAENRAIAARFAGRVLRKKTDAAFVMDFGYLAKIVQPWTDDGATLSAGISKRAVGGVNPRGGTALFDALDRVCRFELGKAKPESSVNSVLLFSDGEDTASYALLKQAVETCQRSNTAIYAFRVLSASGSTGPGALAELADETGGRVFSASATVGQMDEDLREIEADLRNQYRIVYRPGTLKHDGVFHRIELLGSDRVGKVTVRAGYYAPTR